MNQTIRFCTTPDGVRLAYAISGDGPPLVMSATWLSHLEYEWRSPFWRPWLDAFQNDHQLLRHDSRGCGLSDRNIVNLSFETWVADLECVIEAAGFQRFALVGTCWGGPIAIEYAVRHPERVSHLVLYGTYAQGRLHASSRQELEKARVMMDLARLGWGKEGHPYLQVFAARRQPGGTPDHWRAWCDEQRVTTSAETAVEMFQLAWRTDVRGVARKVKCPALILHPERDMVVPIDLGRSLASLVPDARFVQLDSENHSPLGNEPAWSRLVTEVRRFLAEPGALPAAVESKALPLEELTPRERDVLDRIAEGLNNTEIARSLKLSAKTVRNHISHIFDKLDVKHRYQAIVLARQAGLGGAKRISDPADPGHLSRVVSPVQSPPRDAGLNTTAVTRLRVLARRQAVAGARKPR